MLLTELVSGGGGGGVVGGSFTSAAEWSAVVGVVSVASDVFAGLRLVRLRGRRLFGEVAATAVTAAVGLEDCGKGCALIGATSGGGDVNGVVVVVDVVVFELVFGLRGPRGRR